MDWSVTVRLWYGSAQLETIMTHSMDDPATKADKF